MGLGIKFKLLFGGLFLLTLILSALFVFTFLRLKDLKQENPSYYLQEEEGVIIAENDPDKEIILPVTPVLFEYIEVIEGCEPYFEGECLNARSGPGLSFPIVSRLRNGMVLKVGGVVEQNDDKWYKVVFDEWLRYPERVDGDWYVSAKYVRALLDEGLRTIKAAVTEPSIKSIVIDRNKQTLSAYEGEELFMEVAISTGIELTPTPQGTFTIFRKTPSRYMQGPIPGLSEKYWDLPGVPWNLYFTHDGAVIHGTYWHNNFGKQSSNGCVNMVPAEAEKLYKWAEIGTKVIVEN